jgi:hypothetical protein
MATHKQLKANKTKERISCVVGTREHSNHQTLLCWVHNGYSVVG